MVKNPPANEGGARDIGPITESQRFPRVGNGNPLPVSCLESSMDREAWWPIVYDTAVPLLGIFPNKMKTLI